MEVKATVKTEKVYNLTINGKQFDGFRVESEWEGFKKLVNSAGSVIIASFPHLTLENAFDFINPLGIEKEISVNIVSLSPGLLDEVV